MKNKTHRLFYAIELPDSIKKVIATTISYYRSSIKDKIKWVESHNLHLTLRFIGEVSEDRVEILTSLFDDVINKYQPFSYELTGMGCFPNLVKPRVIWIGAGKGKDQLTEIANEIESKLVDCAGLTPEKKPFKPHITIGRLKMQGKPRLTNKCIELIGNDKNKLFGEFKPEYCSLIKSVLTQDGPIYTTIHKSSFNAQNLK